MYYYRLLVEFSHDLERSQFEEFMTEFVEKFMDNLGIESTEFVQDIYIIGDAVTAEYDHLNGVEELRAEMEAPDAIDKLVRGTHFRDYPDPPQESP